MYVCIMVICTCLNLDMHMLNYTLCDTERKEERQRLFDSISVSESVNNDTRERSPEETISRFRFYLGIVCAVMLGLFNGSLQVPFYYYRQHIGKENFKASIRHWRVAV